MKCAILHSFPYPSTEHRFIQGPLAGPAGLPIYKYWIWALRKTTLKGHDLLLVLWGDGTE